tara:strand:+ start:24 stop:260 length:237 start_codon:yes stop_codon:yes gene_type:complete
MEKKPLTANQKEVLNFLNLFYEHYKYMPTQKEIGEGYINEKQLLKSRTDKAAEYLLKGLETRGWIKKEIGKHRAIRLL